MATQREELLHQAHRARRLELRKAAKNRKALGLDTLGEYEPRAPSDERIKGYTNRQLESYIAQSEQYRSRSNQFVKLGRDGVTTRARYEEFQWRQQRVVDQEQRRNERFADYPLDTVGQTIGDRNRAMATRFQRQFDGVPMGYGAPRSADQITSERSMLNLQQRANQWYHGSMRRKKRNQFLQSIENSTDTFDVYSDDDVQQAIFDLKPQQLDLLLNIRDFAHNYFDAYETYKKMDAQTKHTDATKLEQQKKRASRAKNRVLGLINDVKKIPGLGG